MNNSSQTDVDNFIAWYHKEETAYQTGQTNLFPTNPLRRRRHLDKPTLLNPRSGGLPFKAPTALTA